MTRETRRFQYTSGNNILLNQTLIWEDPGIHTKTVKVLLMILK